jgi:hypothetical protein
VAFWLILGIGLAVGLSMVLWGARLLRPHWGGEQTQVQIGIALLTASVISVAIFVLQFIDEDRLRREDAKRQEGIANQALRIQLALTSRPLTLMDLSGENLRNVNLPRRDLSGAIFNGADLREANLRGATLVRARFVSARLDDAILTRAKLDQAVLEAANLAGALMTSATLRRADLVDAELDGAELYSVDLRCARALGASFDGAVTAGWKVRGLEYDETTVFPDGKKRECAAPPCVVRGACQLDPPTSP